MTIKFTLLLTLSLLVSGCAGYTTSLLVKYKDLSVEGSWVKGAKAPVEAQK